MNNYHKHVKNLAEWRNDPNEKTAREKAKIIGYAADCRAGNYLSFIFLKDLPEVDLFEYDILPEEYRKWSEQYKESSKEIG